MVNGIGCFMWRMCIGKMGEFAFAVEIYRKAVVNVVYNTDIGGIGICFFFEQQAEKGVGIVSPVVVAFAINQCNIWVKQNHQPVGNRFEDGRRKTGFQGRSKQNEIRLDNMPEDGFSVIFQRTAPGGFPPATPATGAVVYI